MQIAIARGVSKHSATGAQHTSEYDRLHNPPSLLPLLDSAMLLEESRLHPRSVRQPPWRSIQCRDRRDGNTNYFATPGLAVGIEEEAAGQPGSGHVPSLIH